MHRKTLKTVGQRHDIDTNVTELGLFFLNEIPGPTPK